MSARTGQRGFLMIAAVVLIVVLAFFGLALSFIFRANIGAAGLYLSGSKALFTADSGLEYARARLLTPVLNDPAYPRIGCGATLAGGPTVLASNYGEFNLAVTPGTAPTSSAFYTNAPPLLQNAIAAATPSPIGFVYTDSVAGLAPAGRVMIDRELFDYSGLGTSAAQCGGTGSACLTGVVRARDGTVTAAHATNAPIGEYQCALRSTGANPGFATPLAQRSVSGGVALQEGWAMGSANQVTGQDLYGVTCVDANNCWAVGLGGTIIYWNGAAWTAQTSNTGQDLFGVSCVSVSSCWAVGANGTVVAWNGATWSTTTAGGRQLNGVSMLSPTNGWAVGNRTANSFTGWNTQQWNGTSWTQTTNNFGVRAQDLNGVQTLANEVWTVGLPNGSTDPWTILRRTGGLWGISTVAGGGGPGGAQELRGVAMLDTNGDGIADDGWTVGVLNGNNQLSILRWNHTCLGAGGAATGQWANCSFDPGPAYQDNLNAVAMVSSTDGWIVGNDPGGGRPLMLRWDTSCAGGGPTGTWNNCTPSTTIVPNVGQNLRSVAMVSSTFGWAVGDGGTILFWDGTKWTDMSSPPLVTRWDGVNWNLSSAAWMRRLNGVSMLSYADGWAVGNSGNGAWGVVRWSGNAWNLVPVTTVASPRNLNGVSMISSRDGWAVGNSGNGGGACGNTGRILRWNGTAWSCVRSPLNSNLLSVSMLDTNNDGIADDGWAVSQNSRILRGPAWAVVFNTGFGLRLNGVVAVSSADAWTVGNRSANSNNGWFVWHWNGATWSRTAVTTPGINAANLLAVSCVDATHCWAVGNRRANTTGGWTILRFNGTAWSFVPVTTPGFNAQNLRAVACFNANDCWTVGDSPNGGVVPPAMLHWDGTTWSRATPAPGVLDNLHALALVGPRTAPASAWQENYP